MSNNWILTYSGKIFIEDIAHALSHLCRFTGHTKRKWIRDALCFLFGHKYIVVTTIDNGRSQYGHMLCQRCGEEKNYQYDYQV